MQKEKHKILLVEDDPNLGIILSEYLQARGYENILCKDGEEGIKAFKAQNFDLCILDIMMPKKDGFTLAKEIRNANKHIPFIFLTAKSLKEDTIEGFRIGADDYITKPFSMEELLLRLKAIIRRTKNRDKDQEETLFKIGIYNFDPRLQLLKSRKYEHRLTAKENELLKLLAMNKNQVLDRTQALKAVWEDDSYFNSRSMDVYISKLRKYLKEDPSVEIVNVHGKGFKLLIRQSKN